MKLFNLVFLILAAIFLIVICYFFVDRQIVWFLFEHNSRKFDILKIFANDIVLSISKLIFLFYIYYFIKLVLNKVSNFDCKLLLVSNAVVIGQFVKEGLKGIFGRYWPATFINNNPSLLHDNAYGFNLFHSGSTYASFPSGHATFIFSFCVSMWILFPKLRWLWGLLSFLVVLGQLGMYYHFASDLIAGALLGTLVGLYTASYYKPRV